ncbi:MAG: GIY-YIG nuclease family protein [Poseidonia sp.]
MPNPGNIYLLRDRCLLNGSISNYLKIGKSVNDTSTRISQHQTGNPRVIFDVGTTVFPYMTNAETYLHHWFSVDRIHGEWFNIDAARMTAEVDPKIADLLAEQNAYAANEAIIDTLKTAFDNGNVRPPTSAEQTLSDELRDAREALKIAKAQHEIHDFALRTAIGTANGIEGILTLIEKTQADYFDKAAFIASLSPTQFALCHSSGSQFESKINFDNKGQSLTALNSGLAASRSGAKTASPTTIPLSNLANPETPRSSALETLHTDWLSTRRAIAEQSWIIKQKEAELKVSIGLDQEITGVLKWTRGDVPYTDKWSKADADANLATEVASFTSPRSNIVAVEINECRPYP